MCIRDRGCIFCEKPEDENDRENLIVFRGKRCFAILNLFPYTTGHIMIAPYVHTGTIEELEPETLTEMMVLAQRSMSAIREAFGPDGFNPVSYTHLRAHETRHDLVCRLLL